MRGRPKKEVIKDITCSLRLTKEEHELLEFMAYEMDMTKTEVIKRALRVLDSIRK